MKNNYCSDDNYAFGYIGLSHTYNMDTQYFISFNMDDNNGQASEYFRLLEGTTYGSWYLKESLKREQECYREFEMEQYYREKAEKALEKYYSADIKSIQEMLGWGPDIDKQSQAHYKSLLSNKKTFFEMIQQNCNRHVKDLEVGI